MIIFGCDPGPRPVPAVMTATSPPDLPPIDLNLIKAIHNETMNIRKATAVDCEILFDIWLRSVQATHTFLSEEEIRFFSPYVREYLSSHNAGFWVLCRDSGEIMGFMGMEGNKIEALFIAPEFQRQGGGQYLVQYARGLEPELTVDVNEQNEDACRFYEACGFLVERRSEVDTMGRPFPLLHMRLRGPDMNST